MGILEEKKAVTSNVVAFFFHHTCMMKNQENLYDANGSLIDRFSVGRAVKIVEIL